MNYYVRQCESVIKNMIVISAMHPNSCTYTLIVLRGYCYVISNSPKHSTSMPPSDRASALLDF